MKWDSAIPGGGRKRSLPAGGAWVEMESYHVMGGEALCRSPQGERGLKSQPGRSRGKELDSRSPQGERGLK